MDNHFTVRIHFNKIQICARWIHIGKLVIEVNGSVKESNKTGVKAWSPMDV